MPLPWQGLKSSAQHRKKNPANCQLLIQPKRRTSILFSWKWSSTPKGYYSTPKCSQSHLLQMISCKYKHSSLTYLISLCFVEIKQLAVMDFTEFFWSFITREECTMYKTYCSNKFLSLEYIFTIIFYLDDRTLSH